MSEVYISLDEAERQAEAPPARAERAPLLVWYGDKPPEPPPWLVRDLLPQTQVAIVAGQFSAGKTFLAMDLALAVMTGEPFAGREVVRQGAVLWLAAEGQNEVDIRLKAAALAKCQDDMRGLLPFARQAQDVPRLTGDEALAGLKALAAEAATGLDARFEGITLALIVVDTLNSAAGFGDANDGAEAQRVMNTLRDLSKASGALVLVVDHFGKLVETGVKGSQNKSDSADTILSALADKDADGNISNRRLAVFKQRIGASGNVMPFRLVPVTTDDAGHTSCCVEWLDRIAAPATKAKTAWPGKSRVFKSALECALLDHGEPLRPFGAEGPEVRAVVLDRVRVEFYRSYPAEDAAAKRQAFRRFMADAAAKALIGAREIAGTDWLWLVKAD